MTDEGHEHLDVIGWEAHPLADAAHQRHPATQVVSRLTLADVVEPRADEQQVGAGHPPCHRCRVGGRLAEVAIDRESVQRVALGSTTGARPFGQNPLDQPALVERLEHRNRAVAGGEQADERVTCFLRPSSVEGGGDGSHPVEGRSIDRHCLARRDGSRAQHERRVGADVDLRIDMQRTIA